jgi:hypothetical protein
MCQQWFSEMGLVLDVVGFLMNDPICEIIARKVIEIDAAGTYDPGEIAKLAVKQLGLP